MVLVNEILNILFSDFNYGKSDTVEMMPFARKSVEKFLFSKLYGFLFEMYLEKYAQDDKSFEEKAKNLKSFTPVKLFQSLEVNFLIKIFCIK